MHKILRVIDGGLQLSPTRVGKRKKEVIKEASQRGIKDMMTKKTLIYMCFLEAARQVSEVDREKGVLILKLWHSYFDQVRHLFFIQS